MSPCGNNFVSAGFDSAGGDNDFDFRGYPFDATNSRPSARTTQATDFDLNASTIVPTTAITENLWLEPSPNDHPSRYPGATVHGASWNGFADSYSSQVVPASDNSTFRTDGVDELDALRQRYLNEPERLQQPMAGPSTVTQPALPGSLPTAVVPGPTFTPYLVPTLSWGSAPFPTASSITTVGKGKARATSYSPPQYHSTFDNTMRQYHWPHDDAGSDPYLDAGVPNTDLSTMIASSSGPQRSKRGAVRKGNETEEDRGRRKCAPKRSLPPDINWVRTCDRFYWEMIQTYLLQPSGGLPTPEAAYAKINEFIKEDLHQSPLAVKELGVNPIRELERYLTGILNVLYPARGGRKRAIQHLLDQVADEIERGLFMVNDTVALRDCPFNRAEPEDLDDSAKRVRHRKVEKERRDASHETLRRMSFFFKAPPRSLSRSKVLFFAVTYLMLGVEAFGDSGFVIAFPKL